MLILTILFWTCLALVAYTYVGYPLLLALVSLWRRDRRALAPFEGSFSFILCVHNEEANLARRLEELARLVRSSGLDGEIIVVCDGSTDRSVEIARSFAGQGVIVVARPEKEGKAAALSAGSATARGDILVFCDARQRWADDALTRLLENFAEPRVGAVSGDLVLESTPGVLAGVGLYWRFEKWLRKTESRLYSQTSVTGAISACRRDLFRPPPAGTLCDDMYWPLLVAMQGYRVLHDARALAFDRLPERPRDEYRRKVRTLAGNYQLVGLLPAALLPWRNPVWFQWLSHKILRLAVPWALLGLAASNLGIVLLGEGNFWSDASYWGCLALQAAGYLTALAGLLPGVGRRFKLTAAAGSFVVLNTAAFLAFWVWISGRAGGAWRKVDYRPPLAA